MFHKAVDLKFNEGTSFLGKGMHINSEMKDFYVTSNCHATQIQYR